MEEKKLNDGVLNLYNTVEFIEEKSDVDILKDQVAEAIIKNKKVEYPSENYFSVTPIVDQIIKEKKESEIQYLEITMELYSKDFKTIKNIEDEKQKDVFRAATNANEGMEINNKIAIDDWTIDDENNKRIKISSDTKEYINGILKTITKNTEEIPFQMVSENENI